MDNISTDLDGVIYDWAGSAYQELVMYHGLKEDYNTFWCNQVKGKDPYSELFWKNICLIRTLCDNQKANQEDVDTLNKLAEKYNIYYITHRPQDLESVTTRWLKRSGFPSVENLIFGRKDVVIPKLNIKYFFEDRLDIADTIKEFTTVILKSQPWNAENTEYIRVPTLAKVLEFL